MKKKLLGAILSTALSISMAMPAFAEIIWTPDKLPAGYTTNEWENKDFSFFSGTAIKKDSYTYYAKDLHGNFMKNAMFAGGARTDENGVWIFSDGRVASYGSEEALINIGLKEANEGKYRHSFWHQDLEKPHENGISNYWYGDIESGTSMTSKWRWLMVSPDGKQDGLEYAYCFNEYGYLYTNTITPDGYQVNELGQLMIDGKVKNPPKGHINNYNYYPIGHLVYDPETRALRDRTKNPFF